MNFEKGIYSFWKTDYENNQKNYLHHLPSISKWATFFKVFGVGGILPPQSTSLSAALEIDHAYILLSTPKNLKKFAHIEILDKLCG